MANVSIFSEILNCLFVEIPFAAILEFKQFIQKVLLLLLL